MASAPSDDLKYLSKYKDLKQKVKDIELDNDRLQLKVLKTKKNIHRLRIERAILYERLSTMPNAQPQPEPRQAVFSSPEIQAQMDQRRHLEAAHRAHPPPAPSPPRLHSLPPIHAPIDIPPRSRHAHHPRDTERLPASLPLPPNALPYPPRDRAPPRDRPLGGPGLPPMRTHSSRPSSSHSGYAHPLQHPFMSPDDRNWERERERERDFPPREPHGNGYRDEHHLRRYDPEPAPPSNGLPDSYARTRSSHSHSHSHDPSSSSSSTRWEQQQQPDYHQYDFRRGSNALDPELRGYPEMASELLDSTFEHHRPAVPQKRSPQDGIDEPYRDRRRLHRERAEDDVPRVQEGMAMD